MALCHRREQDNPRRYPRKFCRVQCAGSRRPEWTAIEPVRPAQACRSRRSTGSSCGFCRSLDRAGSRARTAHHAGNDRIFRGDGGAHDLACGARARHRHGLGLDPRSAKKSRKSCSTCRPTGNSSVIFVSAIRWPTIAFPSWNRAVGSGGACRLRLSLDVKVDRPAIGRFCSPRTIAVSIQIRFAGTRLAHPCLDARSVSRKDRISVLPSACAGFAENGALSDRIGIGGARGRERC